MNQGEAVFDPRHTRDLRGMVFGRLHVVRFAGYRLKSNRKRVAYWWATCSCNSEREYEIPASSLLSGNTKSHGCLRAIVTHARHEIVRQSYIGKRQDHPNSRLEVIGIQRVGTLGKPTILRCLCHGPRKDHPKEIPIRLSDFISFRVMSCGCLWDEVRIAATRRRHADYREMHGFGRDQLMGKLNKVFRGAIKPLKIQVILRDGRSCLLCGTSKWLEIHHCVPIHENRSRAADPFNLATLCRNCHRMRAHAGNIMGPVDPGITAHLHRMVAVNESVMPTMTLLNIEPIQSQVETLFGFRDIHGRSIRVGPKSEKERVGISQNYGFEATLDHK